MNSDLNPSSGGFGTATAPPESTAIPHPYEYRPERRALAKAYSKGKLMSEVLNGRVVPLAFLTVFFFTGGSSLLRGVVEVFMADAFLVALLYVGVFLSLLTVIGLPLGFYSGYLYEHRFGLSNQTLRGWVGDFVKILALTFLLGIPLITALYLFVVGLPYWWLAAGGFMVLFSLIAEYLLPLTILPLFYKTEPYADQAQIARLKEMAARVGVKAVEKVVVAKESERSVKANAMLVGAWRSKRIVLFDTLTQGFPPDEVETVVAHELAHHVHRDSWRFLGIEAAFGFLSFLTADLVLNRAVGFWGVRGLTDPATLPLLVLVVFGLDLAALPLINAYSRRREGLADLFALDVARKPEAQISAEKRLSDLDLSDINPHSLIERLFFTHPPASKRIGMAEEWRAKNEVLPSSMGNL